MKPFILFLLMGVMLHADDQTRSITIIGKVLQMQASGALINYISIAPNGVMAPNQKSILEDSDFDRSESSTPIFVVGVGKDVVDGDHWNATVYSAGTVSYTGADGALHTVRRYAVTPEMAAALLGKDGSASN
jgi:hypothetical protein